VRIADLNPIDSPLIVSPDELAEIVAALGNNKDFIIDVLVDPPIIPNFLCGEERERQHDR
jgi:hypothetical protein